MPKPMDPPPVTVTAAAVKTPVLPNRIAAPTSFTLPAASVPVSRNAIEPPVMAMSFVVALPSTENRRFEPPVIVRLPVAASSVPVFANVKFDELLSDTFLVLAVPLSPMKNVLLFKDKS